MPKILRRLRINEVSSVTRGAGEGVQIMLMKRDDDNDEQEYWKREFSSEQRESAAESGAALPDGSFPIHNKSDLHNAMQAIGRAKDPGKAKAHIKRRAKALGLTGELSDAFKSAGWTDFFINLFSPEPDRVAENFDQALAGLAESVKSIIDDADDSDKQDMLAKTFAQFHEHVSPLLGDRALPTQPTDKKEFPMSAILKALGLSQDASEEDALKAIAEMAKQRPPKKDEEDEEEEEEEEEEDEEKALKALPAGIRKMIADGQDAIKRVAKLENEAALAAYVKQAIDIGLPESEASTLQKAYSGDKESVDKLLKLTKSSFAAAKQAGVFKEFGAPGNGASGSAFDQFTTLATQYLKDHPSEKLTPEQAFAKVYSDPAHKHLRVQDARESGRS